MKPPAYAVIFRTHFWDDFVERQFRRLQERVGDGVVYVLVDETRGPVPGIPTDKVFRLTDSQILEAGFVSAGEGSIQWFSGDVPLYMFRSAYPEFRYYVQLEYDVNLHVGVDDLVQRVAVDGGDMVSLERRPTLSDWHWMDSVRGVYPAGELVHHLICLSIFSGRALDALASARLRQAKEYQMGNIPAWPFCEAFLPIEGARLGLKLVPLSSYGAVTHYDWWPPYPESSLPGLKQHAFVHPVLDRDRFVTSMFKYPNVRALLHPGSLLHRQLRRLGARDYLSVIGAKSFRKLALSTLRDRLRQRRVPQAARV